jgi:TolB-like protein
MRTKGRAVPPVLEMTENRAKCCQVSGHYPTSNTRIGSEIRTLPGGLAAIAQVEGPPSSARCLVSWKEVAAYLHCTIRSVQRWERSEGLPVHRHLHRRGSTVYAFSGELDSWMGTRKPLEASHTTASRFSIARARLFVLPFVNLGNDPQMNSLCDGLTEEIVFQLASLNPKRFGIVADTTSKGQKTVPKTLSEMGTRLGVTSVMKGCLRSSGRRIRITAQLILTSDQTQIWTECFEGQASDPLEFQLEIAKQILHSLHGQGILPEADQPRPVTPALPLQTLENFQPGKHEIGESQIKHSKPNSQGSTGTRQEPATKESVLRFVIVMRAPKDVWIQEPGPNIPC